MTKTVAEKRKVLALESIKSAFGTEAGEDSVDLFIEHHIEELPPAYWQQHLQVGRPEALAVLGLLQWKSSWGDGDIEYFDFTLPDDVTNYVLSVHFDEQGSVDGLSMES